VGLYQLPNPRFREKKRGRALFILHSKLMKRFLPFYQKGELGKANSLGRARIKKYIEANSLNY